MPQSQQICRYKERYLALDITVTTNCTCTSPNSMTNSDRKPDYTIVHPAPGHGQTLGELPNSSDELFVGPPFPSALLPYSVTSSVYAVEAYVRKAL